MISITLNIEEKNGAVQVAMVSPPSPSATALETVHAGLMCKGIRDCLAAIQQIRGGGILIERSTVPCPKCQKIHQKRNDVVIYTCECGQSFGA